MMGASAGALLTYIRARPVIHRFRDALKLQNASPVEAPASPIPQSRMQALIIGTDPAMVATFSQAFGEKAIAVRSCLTASAASECLSSEKFEAVVADFDDISACPDIVEALPGPNKHILVFAVATSDKTRQKALYSGTGFIIGRPLTASRIRELVSQGYGRMLRDGQSYFRLAVELPVSIRKPSGAVLHYTTINISRSGMAVQGPSSLTIGEEIGIGFALPNTDIFVGASGRVIWDDKHGKSGLSFACSSTSVQRRFYDWLDDQFFSDCTAYVPQAPTGKSAVVST